MKIAARVKPRSKKERVSLEGDVLVVAVSAPPVDGKANARLVEVLAEALGLAKRDVVLVRGETARHKELEVPLTLEEIRARLA